MPKGLTSLGSSRPESTSYYDRMATTPKSSFISTPIVGRELNIVLGEFNLEHSQLAMNEPGSRSMAKRNTLTLMIKKSENSEYISIL